MFSRNSATTDHRRPSSGATGTYHVGILESSPLLRRIGKTLGSQPRPAGQMPPPASRARAPGRTTAPKKAFDPNDVIIASFVPKGPPKKPPGQVFVGNRWPIEEVRDWASKLLSTESVPDRCLLVSGPTGVGKTTAVRAILEEHGFEVYDVNSATSHQTMYDRVASMITGKAMTKSGAPMALLVDDFDEKAHPNSSQWAIADIVRTQNRHRWDSRRQRDVRRHFVATLSRPLVVILNDRNASPESSAFCKAFDTSVAFHAPTRGEFEEVLSKWPRPKGWTTNDLRECVPPDGSGDIRAFRETIDFFVRSGGSPRMLKDKLKSKSKRPADAVDRGGPAKKQKASVDRRRDGPSFGKQTPCLRAYDSVSEILRRPKPGSRPFVCRSTRSRVDLLEGDQRMIFELAFENAVLPVRAAALTAEVSKHSAGVTEAFSAFDALRAGEARVLGHAVRKDDFVADDARVSDIASWYWVTALSAHGNAISRGVSGRGELGGLRFPTSLSKSVAWKDRRVELSDEMEEVRALPRSDGFGELSLIRRINGDRRSRFPVDDQ